MLPHTFKMARIEAYIDGALIVSMCARVCGVKKKGKKREKRKVRKKKKKIKKKKKLAKPCNFQVKPFVETFASAATVRVGISQAWVCRTILYFAPFKITPWCRGRSGSHGSKTGEEAGRAELSDG